MARVGILNPSTSISFLMPLSGVLGEPIADNGNESAPAGNSDSGNSNSQDVMKAIAGLIINDPDGLRTLLVANGLSLPKNVSRFELKDALFKKLAENNAGFNERFSTLLASHVKTSKYSNLFGFDDILNVITSLVNPSSGNNSSEAQVNAELVKLQAEKEKAAIQQTIIGFGIFGIIVLTVAIVAVKSSKK